MKIISKSSSQDFIAAFAFLTMLGLTVVIYFPGLSGGFYFDDTHVIETNRFIKLSELNIFSLVSAADSFSAGGRQLSMLSFALNYYFFGDSAWWYKFVNLIIHCINGIGLYFLCCQIFKKLWDYRDYNKNHEQNLSVSWGPLIVTSLWLVSPINLTSVLYISQRMTLMAGFFIIYGLLSYCWLRSLLNCRIRKLIYLPLCISAFAIVGYRCKENAVLIFLYVFLIEVLVFKFRSQQDQNQKDREILWLFLVSAIVTLLVMFGVIWQNPGLILDGYDNRYFSLTERILTQFRALVFYIYQIVIPSNHHLSLWHDDFILSTGLFAPFTTFISFCFLTVGLVVAILKQNKMPLFCLGVLWFFVSHSIESTILHLELVHEHRNYLASFGILLAIAGVMLSVFRGRQTMFFSFSFVFLIGFSYVLHQRAYIWSDDLVHAKHMVREQPNSAVAFYQLGKRYYVAKIKDDKAPDVRIVAESTAFDLIKQSALNDKYTIVGELFLVLMSELDDIDFERKWLISATEKLRKHPYMAPSQLALSSYYECMRAGKCKHASRDLDALFDVAYNADNHVLLTTAAFYYAQINIDYDRAESAFKRALADDAVTWINYLEFLLRRKKNDVACQVLQSLESRIENKEINRLIFYLPELIRFRETLKNCIVS